MGIYIGNNMMGINMENSAKAWTCAKAWTTSPHNLRNEITKMRPAAHFCDLISGPRPPHPHAFGPSPIMAS